MEKYAIYRKKKNGEIYKKQLVTGETKQECWNIFNHDKIYEFYSDTTIFVCLKIS